MTRPAPDRVLLRRLTVLALVLGLAVAVLLAPAVHARVLGLLGDAEQVIRHRPVAGMVVFTVLAAVSAMLAFVSSTILIPAAVYAWGPARSLVLLWVGWYAGGLAAYGIARTLGQPVVRRLVSPRTLARYARWTRPSPGALVPILLLQLALPSDVAGYLFGLVGCRLWVYALALALAELPYAIGAVYLGQSFVEGRLVPLVATGAAGLLLGAWAARALHGRAAATDAAPVAALEAAPEAAGAGVASCPAPGTFTAPPRVS